LAREIAGPGANAETQELARQVAEAQIDLRRVRYARHQFLSDTLSNPDYDSDANKRMKVKVLSALLRPNPPDTSTEAGKSVTSTPQGPHKLATILLQEAKKLLAMDRSERRALSRRKFAIGAFDAARARAATALGYTHAAFVPRPARCHDCKNCYAQLPIVQISFWQNEAKLCSSFNGS